MEGYMSNLGCFTCLNCGRQNAIKGHSYTNKYCNNKCQQDHRARMILAKKVDDWHNGKVIGAWKQVPDYIKNYLIATRGHRCESCSLEEWNNLPIPLDVDFKDRDPYNTLEENLIIMCPNCRSTR